MPGAQGLWQTSDHSPRACGGEFARSHRVFQHSGELLCEGAVIFHRGQKPIFSGADQFRWALRGCGHHGLPG